MANLFDSPPALSGNEAEQLQSMYRYLMQISEQLNEALATVNVTEFTPAEAAQIRKISNDSTKGDIQSTRNALRSMIIKTADIVRSEMQEISTTLTAQYYAFSEEFGELTETMQQDITANANGIEQNFTYYMEIQSREEGFEKFAKRINERIFSGVIGYDSQTGNPILGIAIGEGVTEYDENMNPHINQEAKMATFTKERLSFWMGDTEVAYFGDKRLHITNAEVSHEMRMGNYVWEVQSDQSLGLMVSIP